MNKENAYLYLPLVQALADGKTLQIEVGSAWDDLDDPSFTRPPQDYRIKPDPRKWIAWIDGAGFLHRPISNSVPQGWTQIEVTETLPKNN